MSTNIYIENKPLAQDSFTDKSNEMKVKQELLTESSIYEENTTFYKNTEGKQLYYLIIS